jgi:serine/threonine-protein kinase
VYDGDEDRTIDELAALAAPVPMAPRNESPTTPPTAAPIEPSGRNEPAAPVVAPPAPARDPLAPRAPRRRRWLAATGVVLLVAALGGLVYLAYQLFRTPTHEVPALEGLTEADARAAVADFEWAVEVQRERSDDEPDVGQVVRTAPSVGESLGEGEPFLIVVSDGPELRSLPDVTGETRSEAETALARVQLRPLPATREYHERVPAGSVISWSVPSDPSLTAGAEVLPGTDVALVVSRGPAPRTVPELVGVTVDDSIALLEELRLEARMGRSVFSNTIPADAVVRIRPEAGAQVERGSAVTLVVSKGPDLVTVPDLENFGVDRVRRRLQRADLRTGEILGSTRGRLVRATVDGVPVNAGDRLVRGTRVDLVFL